jgi:hypothetical protein
MMTNCDETREHLETCEECRLHVIIEARLRTLPVLEPPKGLVDRAMKALPRKVPLQREFLRVAAAAVALIALTVGAYSAHLDQHHAVLSVKEKTAAALEGTAAMIDSWRNDAWKH